MENSKQNHLGKEDHSSHEVLPSLIQAITANEVSGFDSVEGHDDFKSQLKSKGVHPFGIEATARDNQMDTCDHQRTHSISISMPPSPIEAHLHGSNGVLDANNPKTAASATKKTKFYSQPMPKTSAFHPRIDKLKDKRFDSFKTWSGKLERQLSNLRGRNCETEEESQTQQSREFESVPVDRYFDALEGPELDTLRSSEEIVLPKDKTWPFLLRFPISSFGICLGVSSQAIMWKALANSASTKFLNITPDINLVLWLISLALVLVVSSIYALKIIFYFEAVRREYHHPIRVNFFFAPWIALLFLAMGVPPSLAPLLHSSLWYILMAPICCLEIKIYGQWMSGGQRRLSKVANPSNHLSVVGNFVGALFGASMGLREGPIFFFAVGLAHYTVLFVTLYQRLPTNETLPKELHPVFFLFVAAPSVASMAWATIQGSFDCGSRIAYFIALFLYFSLAVRVNFFRGFRFSLAWWAYTFPMTGAAIATIRYSNMVTNVVTKSLTVTLCAVATLTVASLLVTTIIHAFVLRNLFPNDIAIAISERKPKTGRRWYHRRSGSSDRAFEQYLKYSNTDGKDIEASVNASTCSNEELSDSVSKDVEVGHENKVVEP